MEIKDESVFKTTLWSGGKTTELFIYPDDSTFAERNFDFRLSTATVEIESSDFTPFEGIERHLMILSGEMKLEHDGHHSVLLKKGEQDHFWGDWKTRSTGTCVDLNLMLRKVKGALKSIFLAKDTTIHIPQSNSDFQAFYLVEGSIVVEKNGQVTVVSPSLLITKEQLDLSATESAFLVQIEVED